MEQAKLHPHLFAAMQELGVVDALQVIASELDERYASLELACERAVDVPTYLRRKLSVGGAVERLENRRRDAEAARDSFSRNPFRNVTATLVLVPGGEFHGLVDHDQLMTGAAGVGTHVAFVTLEVGSA